WRHHGRQPRLPPEGGRGRLRFPPLSHPQLRQGTTHANEKARQRRPHHAESRGDHRRASLMKRILTVLLLGSAMAWAAPAPPGNPPVPEKFISVDDAMAVLDRRQPLSCMPVRAKAQ